MSNRPHIPVMLDEVLAALQPADGEVYVDGTFGAGGYTAALLDAADCAVIAIDRDSSARARAEELKEKYGERLQFVHGCFGDAEALVHTVGYDKVDGIVVDLGVSSMQLDQAARGFSFRFDGPLDMRMDQDGDGETAADVVNNYSEKNLADIIYRYGEERKSRRIAKAVVAARGKQKIETTFALADIVRSVVPRSPKDQSDPSTRTFQALRIYVNREMEELEKLLQAAVPLLKIGGRLVVVSFHSLEDGIAKRFMRQHAGMGESVSRHMPVPAGAPSQAYFSLPSRKAVFPSEHEISQNPRSRSARLRVAVRTDQSQEAAA